MCVLCHCCRASFFGLTSLVVSPPKQGGNCDCWWYNQRSRLQINRAWDANLFDVGAYGLDLLLLLLLFPGSVVTSCHSSPRGAVIGVPCG